MRSGQNLPKISWTRLLLAGALFAGCGSAIEPPAGWTGFAEPDVVQPDTSTPKDATAEADTPSECATDTDCDGKFALFPCQIAVCSAGKCVAGSEPEGAVCDDGDACTSGEVCSTGTCVPQAYLKCEDGDPCTSDECESATGCINAPLNGGTCNDGEVCTLGDSCTDGVCAGLPTSECYSGNCCAPNETPGCSNAPLQECVCAADPECCSLDVTWTQYCVDLIESAGCGFCPAASCGDGVCEDTLEGCGTCPADCGFCADCGDGTCGNDENCFTCNADCGECSGPLCGDLVCKTPGEDCLSCQADCGECTGAICGDGTCELNEQCQNCPGDCGVCPPGCGDGVCTVNEGCEICPIDCGVCVGNCCAESDSPGCDQQLITECVCASDDYCCTESWDGVCVAQVETEGCAQCTGVVCGDGVCTPEEEDCETCSNDCGECPFCGDGVCDSAGESCAGCPDDCGECVDLCCSSQNGPGCGNPTVEACVCAFDSYCCTDQWDSACASEVEQFGCGTCGGGGGGNSCCSANGTPGCDNSAVQDCVCADIFNLGCCFFSWDASCANAVTQLGCGTCP